MVALSVRKACWETDGPDLWHLVTKYAALVLDDYSQPEVLEFKNMIEEGDYWSIIKPDGTVVGCASFANIVEGLHAEFHIIVDKPSLISIYRHKILELLITKGFDELRVKKLKAIFLAGRKCPQKMAEKLGFRFAGHFWGETKKNGKPIGVVVYELKSSKWRKSQELLKVC